MSKFYSGTIQKGSQGSDVRAWQEFLNSQGYNLTVDGIFGANTYAATTDYQSKNGLTVDGIVGENTWGKAGYSNINTPVSAPTIAPTPTAPTYDTTSWDDTEKGSAAAGAYKDAKDAVSGYGDFTFSEQAWLDKVKENIANYGEFSYNFNEDALYQQAVERYRQMGNMAMQDTMGQAAALTGGYGNSYAVSAGQQAYQSYLQEAHDMLPEYYQMALDRYKMGKDDLYSQYGMLLSEYEREYGLYSDEYNKLLDALGIARDDYYNGADMFYTEQDNKNSVAGQEFTDAMAIWEAETGEAWKNAQWDEAARQYAIEEGWRQKEFDAKYSNSSNVDKNNTTNNTTNNNNPQKEPQKEQQTESKDDYADWDAGDWEAYFASIRQSEGKASAETELNRMIKAGLIPQNMVGFAAIGARGSGGGH